MYQRFLDSVRSHLPDQIGKEASVWIARGVLGIGSTGIAGAGYYTINWITTNSPISPPTGVIQLDAFTTGRPVSSDFDAKHTYPTPGFDKVAYKAPRGQNVWKKWKTTLSSFQTKVAGEQSLLVEGDAPLGLYWLLGRTLERYEGRICVRQASPKGESEDICFANAPTRHIASGTAVLSGRTVDPPSGKDPTTLFVAVNIASPWTNAQKAKLDSCLPARKSSMTLYVEPKDGQAIQVSQDNIDTLRASIAHLTEETLKSKCQTCEKAVIALLGAKTLALAMGATLDYAQIKSGQVFLDWNDGSKSYEKVEHE